MTVDVHFEARGVPVPQGSHRAFLVKGRPVVVNAGGRPLNDWRTLVRHEAQIHAPPRLWEGPVGVQLIFWLPQPRSRPSFAGRGRSRHMVVVLPDRRPDLDKLVRAVIDCLTGVVFRDDAQVVSIDARKEYGTPGVEVRAWPCTAAAP